MLSETDKHWLDIYHSLPSHLQEVVVDAATLVKEHFKENTLPRAVDDRLGSLQAAITRYMFESSGDAARFQHRS